MIKTLFTYGLGESVAKGINWLILATLPLLVASPSDYGIVGLLVAVEGVAGTALLMGLDRAVLRFYYNDKSPARFLSTALVLCLLPLVPLIILAAALSFSVDEFAGIPVFPHLCLLISALFFLNFHKIYLAVLRIEEAPKLYVGLRICFVAVKALIILCVAFSIQDSISYVYGILFASIIVVLITIPGVKKRIQPGLDNATETNRSSLFDSAIAKELWLFGWPFIFHVLSGNLLMFADRFMLEYYVNIAAVGTYTFAYTLGSAVAFIFSALAIYFEPLIYKKAENEEASEKLMGSYSAACILLGAIWGIVVLFLLPFLVADVFGETYKSIIVVTPIVLAAHLIMPIYHQANYRLTLYKKTKVLATGTFVAAALNILLNLLWIPSMGERGAALATFASLAALCGIVFISSIKSTSVNWKNVKSLYILITTIVGTIVLVSVANDTASFIIFSVLALLTGFFLFTTSSQFRMLVLRS